MKYKIKLVNQECAIDDFEAFCNEKNIEFRKYPEPIKYTYGVNVLAELLHDIGHCIATFEPMPKISISGIGKEWKNDK